MQYTLIILSIFLIAYMLYAVKDGVPQSLSATYYRFVWHGWLFQLLMAVLGFGLLPMWAELSPDALQFLCFLACGSLVFVGVSPLFKLPFEGKVHTVSAVVCGVCIVLWQLLMGMWEWLSLSALLCFVGYLCYGKHTWWLECMLMLSLLGNLWKLVL